jgi:hypothetical protein
MHNLKCFVVSLELANVREKMIGQFFSGRLKGAQERQPDVWHKEKKPIPAIQGTKLILFLIVSITVYCNQTCVDF